MSVNCDSATGVAYGVLQGNHVPWLDEDIFENGHDLSFEGYKEDLKERIQSALEDLELPDHPDDERRNFAERYQAMREKLLNLLHALDIYMLRFQDVLVKRCMDHADIDRGTFDIEQVYEELLDEASQFYECEEPEHEHTDGDTRYRRGHLGGAALIWVTKSRFVTPCRTCSPCVPGAGDLDNACPPEEANSLAYCPPPEDWVDDIAEDRKPYVIYHTDEHGYPTEEVAWQRPKES